MVPYSLLVNPQLSVCRRPIMGQEKADNELYKHLPQFVILVDELIEEVKEELKYGKVRKEVGNNGDAGESQDSL